jgi:polyisoprenoid-binding protein YceI
MKRDSLLPGIIVFALTFTITSISAQQAVRLLPDQSEITIKGTSNLHDWEESVENFKVNLDLKFLENELKGIDHVHVTLMSNSIVSDNSIMTNKTHDALNVKKYPQIEFKLVSVDHLSSGNGKFSGTLVGDVTLAGVTKRISLAFSGIHTGNKISIKGSKELNMNDFKINPPKAMLGTLKTGEEVTISFQLNFQVT